MDGWINKYMCVLSNWSFQLLCVLIQIEFPSINKCRRSCCFWWMLLCSNGWMHVGIFKTYRCGERRNYTLSPSFWVEKLEIVSVKLPIGQFKLRNQIRKSLDKITIVKAPFKYFLIFTSLVSFQSITSCIIYVKFTKRVFSIQLIIIGAFDNVHLTKII